VRGSLLKKNSITAQASKRMITIFEEEDRLLLRYESERFNSTGWIREKLSNEGSVTIRRTFTFSSAAVVDELVPDELDSDSGSFCFVLASADGEYYKIDKQILGLKHDLLLSKQMPLTHQTFIANRDISVFRKIDDLVDEPIIVGGNSDKSIPLDEFNALLKTFPTSTELTHYAHARVSRVLKDYLGTMSDAQATLENYLNRKSASTLGTRSRLEFLVDYEPRKFQYVRDELRAMLENAEAYSEKEWQKLIVGFLLLIFPKYIAVIENLHVKDFYSDPPRVTNRYIDLTLVDANGTIDIIEIKKPFENRLLSRGRYRGNYIPCGELSGTVMQAEKYIFHLSKWGRKGEIEILQKCKSELPDNFEISVTNPQAMIILGRDNDFTNGQKFDFEIIKRKYANIIDVMTYDDLLRRLDNIIATISKNYSKLGNMPVTDAKSSA
jgi:Domain of unknown function (DUF4263)